MYPEMVTIWSPVDPDSVQAGRIAAFLADTEDKCCYSLCGESVVGVAVHDECVVDGSSFVPVCERHAGWEHAKLEGCLWNLDD